MRRFSANILSVGLLNVILQLTFLVASTPKLETIYICISIYAIQNAHLIRKRIFSTYNKVIVCGCYRVVCQPCM